MVFDSKLKINLYHKHFPDTLAKYSPSVLVMGVSMERLYAAKFAATFFRSSLFAVLQSMSRGLRFI